MTIAARVTKAVENFMAAKVLRLASEVEDEGNGEDGGKRKLAGRARLGGDQTLRDAADAVRPTWLAGG